MANDADENKVAVNGDTSGWQPDTQSAITIALLQNGGINRIRGTLKQRLDEAGWSEDLRKYIDQLLRSGAAKTYDEVLDIVMKRIQSGEADPQGHDDGVPAPNLSIPQEAQHAGADSVRKELGAVVKKNLSRDSLDKNLEEPDQVDGNEIVGAASQTSPSGGETSIYDAPTPGGEISEGNLSPPDTVSPPDTISAPVSEVTTPIGGVSSPERTMSPRESIPGFLSEVYMG